MVIYSDGGVVYQTRQKSGAFTLDQENMERLKRLIRDVEAFEFHRVDAAGQEQAIKSHPVRAGQIGADGIADGKHAVERRCPAALFGGEFKRAIIDRLVRLAVENDLAANAAIQFRNGAGAGDEAMAALDHDVRIGADEGEAALARLFQFWIALLDRRRDYHDRRFAEYIPPFLDDPDPKVREQAALAVGWLGIVSQLGRLEQFFKDARLRHAALYAYCLAAPGPVSPARARSLFRRIETLAGGLSAAESSVVERGLDDLSDQVILHTGPHHDDIMLGYQSLAFHDVLLTRQTLGLRTAPEFEAWLRGIGMVDETGRLIPFDVTRSPLRELTAARIA